MTSSPEERGWISPDPAPRHEFTATAEMWTPSKAGAFTAGMRKLQAPQQRKKSNDKRESVAQLTMLSDASPKRIREKSSWLGTSKGYTTTAVPDGQWMRVRCVISDLDERECRFTIIGEKETLQHCLNIRTLRSTDIRFADRSLYFRNDCLSIHAPAHAFYPHSPSLQTLLSSDTTLQKRMHPAPALDPIYLAFESREAANTWNAVLRSFAVPEIYGCDIDSRGLFRMWRQVSLSITTARNLAIAKKNSASAANLNSSSNTNNGIASDEANDAAADLQLFCEVDIDGVVMGRTSLQKGCSDGTAHDASPLPTWTWHESFTLSDLPPFGVLGVRIWRYKKGAKPILVGTVEVVLAHVRRGQNMDGWFPILNANQVGDLRMKMKVDEERILPEKAYADILGMIFQKNPFDLIGELDQKLRLQDLSSHMLALAIGRGTFLSDILNLAEREVDNVPSPNTLFRGNSICTKSVEQIMGFFGRPWLEASVGPTIQELVTDRVELETDPARNQKGAKDVENSVRLLSIWCEKFWKRIYDSRELCPPELRRLFQSIRELVEKKFIEREEVVNDLKWQSVSAFAFLRLIVPAILHPHLWGLHPGLPPTSLQRSLTLIAKALQSLANLSKEKKESHMQGVGQFLDDNRPRMISYLQYISTCTEQQQTLLPERYDRSQLRRYLRDRVKTRAEAPLHYEALPALPHFLDLPKHVAIISSAVIRHSRQTPQSLTTRPLCAAQETLVEDFALRCFDVEAKISQHINRLCSSRPSVATIITSRNPLRRITSRNSSSPGSPGGPSDSISMAGQPRQSREIQRTSKKAAGKRPSTAPTARSSSTDSSTQYPPLPSSPSPRILRGKASHDSGASSPPVSPTARVFGHQLSGSQSFAFSDYIFPSTNTTSTVTDSDVQTISSTVRTEEFPFIPDTTEASTDPNRLKKFFSRPAFLGRNQKT